MASEAFVGRVGAHHAICLTIAAELLETPPASRLVALAVPDHHAREAARTLDRHSRRGCQVLSLEEVIDQHRAVGKVAGAVTFQTLLVGVDVLNASNRIPVPALWT